MGSKIHAIITGGTKGIGRAIAERFATEGADIAVCSRTDEDLQSMTTDFQSRHPNCKLHTFKADVRQKEEVQAFAEFVKKELGEVNVLVNNAGIFIPGAVLEEEEGTLEKQIETNLYSAYHLSRALVGSIPEQAGHIFNMCSVASIKAYPNGGSYSISKFAMLGLNHALREELKEKGIKVTAILPGATWSASWEGVELPESRLMPASDIAEAVYSAFKMNPSSVVEEIRIRPQLGDL